MFTENKRINSLIEKWRIPQGRRALIMTVIIVAMILLVSLLVYETGGTCHVWLHLIYIPIFISSATFRNPGGLFTALFAGLVLGPLMPFDTSTATQQKTAAWLFRTVFFMVTAGLNGLIFQWLNVQLDRIRDEAWRDPVSGLPNLQALSETLDRLFFCGTCLKGSPLLAIVDIANGREIINTLGYQCSRALIPQIIERINSINDPSLSVYRLPAERFAVLARDIELHQFTNHCNQVFNWFEKPFQIDNIPILLNVYVGIAQPKIAENSDELIQKASVAAHIAETRGILFATYDEKNDAGSVKTLSLLGSLNAAIENNELELYYQPKINIQTHKVKGAEALVRWNHPTEGLIEPDSYIAQAEKTWLIHPLSLFAVRAALNKLKKWQQQGLDLNLAVNLTPNNLQNPLFISELTDLIRESDIDASCLEIEITERTILTDMETVTRALQSFKKLGATISVDDFGTGYSTAAILEKISVDAIKIDQSFIKKMRVSDISLTFVRRMIEGARDLDLEVTAEGVESEDVFEQLKRMECDVAQGYYISPPLSEDDFNVWLKTAVESGMQE